ncbi:MAG: hypothetical protein RIQ63_1, partial [Actinomycetota bacterium]
MSSPDADLVLDQFTDRANAAVGEVVLVVESVTRLLLNEVQQIRDRRQHFATAEDVLTFGRNVQLTEFGAVLQTEQLTDLFDLCSELAVQLVATDAREVVATALEERAFEVRASRLDVWWLTWTCTLVDLDECFFASDRDGALLFPLTLEEVEVGDEAIEETWCVILAVAECAQQGEDAEATLACDAGSRGHVLAWLLLDVELQPLTAVGVNGALHELVLGEIAQAVTLTWFE